MKTVRISVTTAKAILDVLDGQGLTWGADSLRESLAALDRKRLRQKPRKLLAKTKKQTKRAKTAEVREAVMKRAGNKCESGIHFGGEHVVHLDHFFGRARSESLETCWSLCRFCHEDKTLNQTPPLASDLPGPVFWLKAFITHCDRYGYGDAAREASKRLAFVKTRGSLPSAPRVEP